MAFVFCGYTFCILQCFAASKRDDPSPLRSRDRLVEYARRSQILVMVVMMHAVIMPVVAMMVTVPGHGSPDDRTGARADDRAYGSADSRSGRTSDDSSADGVFASSRARRRGERNTESGDENRYTHRHLP